MTFLLPEEKVESAMVKFSWFGEGEAAKENDRLLIRAVRAKHTVSAKDLFIFFSFLRSKMFFQSLR